MHQVHVQVIELQLCQRLFAGGDHVGFGVLVVPQFAGNPEFLARNSTGQDVAQGEADAVFIAVHAGAIEMAVAEERGIAHGGGDLICRDVIATESAQADSGHAGAGVKGSKRDGHEFPSYCEKRFPPLPGERGEPQFCYVRTCYSLVSMRMP